MKEARFFYVPDASAQSELPEEEAAHALRVLRLGAGSELFLMDGCGVFYRAVVTSVDRRRCGYEIVEAMPQERAWRGHVHLAIAPTKMADRIEWLAEKATEVGIDELSFLNCQYSERRQLRRDRMEKIVVAAAKQSRKPWIPAVNDIQAFKDFIAVPRKGRKFIAHCYEEIGRNDFFNELAESSDNDDVTVLVGPEGDFSVGEVRDAMASGYESISLGSSRLRTETAGLAAVMMTHLRLRLLSVLAFVLVLFGSCSKGDYTRAIPAHCTAIASVDMSDVAPAAFGTGIKALLSGVDVSRRQYFFIAPDGSFGLCAAVGSSSLLRTALGTMAEKGACKPVETSGAVSFTMWNDSWLIGFDDEALIVTGPVLPSDRQTAQQRVGRWLSQEEGQGMASSAMFARLDSIDSPIAFVAQAAAFPEKLAALLLLGAPKDADPSQVMVAAAVHKEDSAIIVEGETYSRNSRIAASLRSARQVLRPISGLYAKNLHADAAFGLLVNADGEQFLPLLHANPAFQALLAGLNMAIDIDKIIKSVDGDMALQYFSSAREGAGQGTGLSMVAELANAEWLADVGYWQQSCPTGGRIDNLGKDAYRYVDGNSALYFGVVSNPHRDASPASSQSALQFYCGSSPSQSRVALSRSGSSVAEIVGKHAANSRETLFLNVASLLSQDASEDRLSAFLPAIRPLLGGVAAVVYTMK